MKPSTTNPSLPHRPHRGGKSSLSSNSSSNSPRSPAERGRDKTIQAVLDLEEDRHQLLQSLYSSRSVLNGHDDSLEPSLEFTTALASDPSSRPQGSTTQATNDPNRHRRQPAGNSATERNNIHAILKLEEDTKYHFLQYSSRSFRK